MKYYEINAQFTAAVKNFLDRGYVLNPCTMAGTQGEIARVDVANADRIVRIQLEQFDRDFMSGVRIVIGAVNLTDITLPRRVNENYVLWNSQFTTLAEKEFYEISLKNDWYGTKQEAVEALDRRDRRTVASDRTCRKDLTAKYGQIARKVVQRHHCSSRVQRPDVGVYLDTTGIHFTHLGQIVEHRKGESA